MIPVQKVLLSTAEQSEDAQVAAETLDVDKTSLDPTDPAEGAQEATDSPDRASATEVLSEEAAGLETVAAAENVEKPIETQAVKSEVPTLAKLAELCLRQSSDELARPKPEDPMSHDAVSPAPPPPAQDSTASASEPRPHAEPPGESSVAEMDTGL